MLRRGEARMELNLKLEPKSRSWPSKYQKQKGASPLQRCFLVGLACFVSLCIVAPLVYVSFETAAVNYNRYDHYDRIVRGFTHFDWAPFYVAYHLTQSGKLFLLLLLLSCCVGCVAVALTTLWSSGLLPCTRSGMNQSGSRFGQLANASRVNACSIAILIVVPLTVFTLFALFDLPMNSYSIPLFLGVAFVPILNAHFIIFNIRTFRRALSTLLSFKSKSIGPISHISSDH
ncbi:hypothetical protein Y032_0051g2149 [Ancylostoma ceylanicum]|uniref:Uncharacterized protein n=2 Tax=Ancylostoma ceylanicum TaxID=53326 RepID=A0A016U8Y5_9BILA|nr:hypothetical protein Y032_0051g2149 [Ancylostoma ceylanicum]